MHLRALIFSLCIVKVVMIWNHHECMWKRILLTFDGNSISPCLCSRLVFHHWIYVYVYEKYFKIRRKLQIFTSRVPTVRLSKLMSTRWQRWWWWWWKMVLRRQCVMVEYFEISGISLSTEVSRLNCKHIHDARSNVCSANLIDF